MDENRPTGKSRPGTFSLGTLFLIMTSAGVGSVAFRVASDRYFEEKAALAIVFVGAFLSLWYFVTFQYRRLQLAASLSLGGMILAAFVAVPVNRVYSYRNQCALKLKQIGVALLNYHQAYGSFPPAYVADSKGKPLHSWRVLILPYLEETRLAKAIRYDEAWNGPTNGKLVKTHLTAFDCPEDSSPGKSISDSTNYFAVVGPHTAWAGTKPRKLSDFKDLRKTILVVEVVNAGVHWAEPRDLYIGKMAQSINASAGPGISSSHDGGAWAVFADDHVEFLPNSTDPKKLAEMLDLDGGTDSSKTATGS